MPLRKNPEVDRVFKSYPAPVRRKLLRIRKLIEQCSKEAGNLDTLQETLKWGEPAYLAKRSSTIRIAWSPTRPDQYGVFFNCNSKLVGTFRVLFKDTFQYDGNRALIFHPGEEIPEEALRECLSMALTYHDR